MEVENSTGIIESERELPHRTKETKSSVRKKKGSRIIISSGEEEEEISAYMEDETSRKGKRRGTVGKQRRKANQKDTEENRQKKGSSQIDFTKETEEEDMQTDEKRRKSGVGKERKIIGVRQEAKDEHEYLGITTQELKDYAVMLLKDAETVRLKTKTMQGGLNGILKDRIVGLRGVIKCLIEKLEDKGDTIYYKTKNGELMVENKRLKKEAEKWEQEKNMKDKEIETYRSMYEEADNKYVEAEKRINKMDKRRHAEEKGKKNGGKEGKQERLEEAYLKRKSLRIGEEKMDTVEEFPQARRDLDDERWPAIRPPILGKSRILTPEKIKTSLKSVRGQEESDNETPKRTGNTAMRTPSKRFLRMFDESEKEDKKR